MTTSPSRKSGKRKRKLTPTSLHKDFASSHAGEKEVYKRSHDNNREDSVTVYGGNFWHTDYTDLYPNHGMRQNKLFMTEQKLSAQVSENVPIVIKPPDRDYFS